MFWSRYTVDADIADWVEEGFAWLIETFGPAAFFDGTPLILPTTDFFASPAGEDHETALALFDEVRAHMGIGAWPCILVRQEADPDARLSAGVAVVDGPRSAGGTFQVTDDAVILTYDPAMMAMPLAFLTVLSHEAAHYRLAGVAADAPGGEAAHELMTDLAAIHAGFGLIQLEGGRVRETFGGPLESGWRIGTLGYLSSETRAHALALFMRTKGIGIEVAAPHLSPDNLRLLGRALKSLTRHPRPVERMLSLAPQT